MKATSTRRSGVLTVVAALLLTLLGGGSAGATNHRAYITDNVVDDDGDHEVLADLNITASDGDKIAFYSRFVVTDSTHRLLLELHVNCTSTPSTNPASATTRNFAPNGSGLMINRFVWEVPSTGTHNCKLVGRSTVPGGSSVGGQVTLDASDSYFEYVAAPSWATQREYGLTNDVLIEPGEAADLGAFYWTAPSGVNSFRAVGDVHLTNCYDSNGLCDTSPSNTGSATAGTKLQVMQLATGGGYCNITNYPSSGEQTTTIDRTVHHLKAYHRTNVNVSTASNCTREFRIKVYTRHVSGNDLHAHIEGVYSQFFVYP